MVKNAHKKTCNIRSYGHIREIQNETNSKNGHLVFSIFKKKQENNGVGDISSLFQRHCQTNRLYYKQAVLYTANSIKVVFPKAQTVKYERSGDDGLLSM